MRLISIARKYLNHLTADADKLFTYSLEKQKQFLNRYSLPLNDFYRSWYQYLAQRTLNGKFRTFCLNVISFPIYYILKRKAMHQHYSVLTPKKLVYHIYDADRSLMPTSLNEEFSSQVYYESEDMALTSEDLEFLKALKRQKRWAYYFHLKILTKMAIYRAVIQKFQPMAIATCSEYSFTASVLTEWLEMRGIEHINMMHGEKLFQIRDSYARFTRYYVWDAYYKDLLGQLHFPQEQFIVEIPPGLKGDNNREQSGFVVDITYYLANESRAELDIIWANLTALRAQGKQVRLRPHPRYTDFDYLKQICPPEFWENGLSLSQSLHTTRYAVSLYSTVLQQAYANHVDIIIDDLKNSEKFMKLEDLQYIMLKRKHMLLSEMLNMETEG